MGGPRPFNDQSFTFLVVSFYHGISITFRNRIKEPVENRRNLLRRNVSTAVDVVCEALVLSSLLLSLLLSVLISANDDVYGVFLRE